MTRPGDSKGRVDLFVSYAGVDRPWAEWAASVLETAGMRWALPERLASTRTRPIRPAASTDRRRSRPARVAARR